MITSQFSKAKYGLPAKILRIAKTNILDIAIPVLDIIKQVLDIVTLLKKRS